MLRRSLRVVAVLAALAALPSLPPFAPAAALAGDPATDLKDSDVQVRLAAIDALRAPGAANAEELLLAALADADWEVVEKASFALGEKGGAASVKPLVKVASEHPVRRIRIVAARSLARLDSWAEAAAEVARGRPDELAQAFDNLSAFSDRHEGDVLVKAAERGLGMRKDAPARASGARLIGAWPAQERAERLRQISGDDDITVAAAAIDGVRAKPADATTAVLLEIAARPKVAESVARRARAGYVEAVAAKEKGSATTSLGAKVGEALKAAKTPEAAWNLARLLGELGEIVDEHVPRKTLIDGLRPVFEHAESKVRASVAWACGRIGGDEGFTQAVEMAKTDADPRVRFVALQSAARIRTAEVDAAFRLFTDRATYDTDPNVREEACVHLGRRGVAGAIPTLRKSVERAFEDKSGVEWPVAAAALVSIGKTRAPEGVDFLIETAAKAKDWKLRGAAVVGLGHVRDVRAVPALIEALGAKDVHLRTAAFEFLRRLIPDPKLSSKQADWKAWWEKNARGFAFVDREEEIRKAKKFGYAPDMTGVYEGLDVVVFQSRGDKIEDLLAQLRIEHRLTRSSQVAEAGLHPHAIFVSNCTGEIVKKDIEPLQWFVHTGGHFFGSCWSLHETIEDVVPGVVRKYQTKQEVLANVISEPCRSGSPYLDGVFAPLVRPVYVLYGAHIIELLDPERAEVLMDSPWTEEKYGAGNLVAWFSAGHGVVLDSANHFEKQGFERADGLKSSEDRMAYALDHLGLSWAEFRAIPSGAWKSAQDAGKDAKDLSCFRFITNFVREKRKASE